MTYSLGNQVYTEHFIGENGEYEQLLRSSQDIRTSQSTPHAFHETFLTLRAAGQDVLCLTISSRLSGTYSNASMVARELGDERIRVVDTATTAGGMLLMIREARKLATQGFSLEQVHGALLALRPRVRTLFTVKDMGPLRRSGRLGSVRQSVGTLLNVRPLLTCNEDGSVEDCGLVRGRNEQLKSLTTAVSKDAEAAVVHHITLAQDAHSLADALVERGVQLVEVREVGPVLGVHLGTEVLSVMWRERAQ
jgi:DegV family protein with EDD domain